tara:strand:+ start:215 stop:397 length:183 start_codon:yes stop_codon:yes gene_type:complete
MITDRKIIEDYESMITKMKKRNAQCDVAIQGLKAIIESGQINIAIQTLKEINRIDNNFAS